MLDDAYCTWFFSFVRFISPTISIVWASIERVRWKPCWNCVFFGSSAVFHKNLKEFPLDLPVTKISAAVAFLSDDYVCKFRCLMEFTRWNYAVQKRAQFWHDLIFSNFNVRNSTKRWYLVWLHTTEYSRKISRLSSPSRSVFPLPLWVWKMSSISRCLLFQEIIVSLITFMSYFSP